MPSEADPIVGNWYQRLDKGQEFQVVALDEEAGLVEMQHFDGDLEEMEVDTWYQLDIVPIEEPEDWSGPLDVGEIDDLTGTEVTDTQPQDWGEPLDELAKHQDIPPRRNDELDERDDWGEGRMAEEPLGQEPAAGRGPAPEAESGERSIDAWSEEES